MNVKLSSPAFVTKPENVTVLDGEDVTLLCNVTGAPLPTVQWRFNDYEPINSEGRYQINRDGSLIVISAEVNVTGKYTCIRQNSAGRVS